MARREDLDRHDAGARKVAPGGHRPPDHGVARRGAPGGPPGGGPARSDDQPDRLDLAAVRRRLAGKEGPRFWRSLEELAGNGDLEELLEREFPRFAAEWPDGVSRRRFLQLMGASVALGGLTACTRQPGERIVPYVQQPPELTPGEAQSYASAFTLGGFGTGVVVQSHQGRPTKIEGNELHPASLGGTDLFAQASVLGLYDPDRSQTVRNLTRIRTWEDFFSSVRTTLSGLEGAGGARLAVLTPTVTSPTLTATIETLLDRYPSGRWVSWEPVNRDAVRAGVRTAFGVDAVPRYDLSRAEVIVSLDSDILTTGAGHVRYAHDFAARRRPTPDRPQMSRLYALESTPTNTGALADHRRAEAPHLITRATLTLARRLGIEGIPPFGPVASRSTQELDRWTDAMAEDLLRHRGRSLVVAGAWADADTHALVLAINERLGNLGSTVRLQEPIAAGSGNQAADLERLVSDMRASTVDALLILGGNPVFDAPADLEFAEAMQRVPTRARIGLYDNETSELCHWHLPASHDLEAWGDVRAFDGTATVVQPLIEPLYRTRSALQLVAALSGESDPVDGHELVRATWLANLPGPDPEAAWRRALHDGVIPRTTAAVVDGAAQVEPVGIAATRLAASADADPALTITFRPDPTIWDGRFANSGWLQECPKPASKLTWDNAAIIAPATAERLGLATEQVVRIEAAGRTIQMPVWTQPGQAEDTLTLHLGYGRRRTGRVGNGTGFDVFPLRTRTGLWRVAGVRVTPTGGSYPLVSTQLHQNLDLESTAAESRHVLRSVTLEEYAEHPEVVRHMGHAPGPEETLYPDDHEYDGYSWGMAIDLNACTGCNACVIACVSENNIPVVGKEQVAMGREMPWIRIDRYFEGGLEGAAVHFQPVTCMHCENAPCEVVCPVGATVHSDEGLNDMVYNRCVGTRYCSNNCPYKVRRFNFFNYNARTPNDAKEAPVLSLLRNPDVTVRSRGVMEKCTYCVQRIEQGKIEAHVDGRQVQDGDIRTACQQACPSRAISFGDINDADSEVSRWKAEPREYGMLADLGTRPRTTYLAKIRNPNPEVERLKGST